MKTETTENKWLGVNCSSCRRFLVTRVESAIHEAKPSYNGLCTACYKQWYKDGKPPLDTFKYRPHVLHNSCCSGTSDDGTLIHVNVALWSLPKRLADASARARLAIYEGLNTIAASLLGFEDEVLEDGKLKFAVRVELPENATPQLVESAVRAALERLARKGWV